MHISDIKLDIIINNPSHHQILSLLTRYSPLVWTPTYKYEAAAEAGEEAWGEAGDDALDSEGEDQLEGPEAGHQVGGDELEGPGQGGEGQ